MHGVLMAFDQVDIVVPVYRNRDTLRDLYEEVLAATKIAGIKVRFIFVDDACPDRSTECLAELDVTVLHQPANTGQQAAIRRGLMICGDNPVIVMDADLQDPPEAIPLLLSTLHSAPCDVVFAARQGRYQSWYRSLTATAFRAVVQLLVSLPAGAGGYLAINAKIVRCLQKTNNPRFYLAGLVGCYAQNIEAIPIERRLRQSGQSAYSGAMRWRTGISNIKCILYERTRHGDVKRQTRRT